VHGHHKAEQKNAADSDALHLVTPGYQTRSLKFSSDRQTIKPSPKAHKPADSGVPVGNDASWCSLREVTLTAIKHTRLSLEFTWLAHVEIPRTAEEISDVFLRLAAGSLRFNLAALIRDSNFSPDAGVLSGIQGETITCARQGSRKAITRLATFGAMIASNVA
jgi:hypothetical protein